MIHDSKPATFRWLCRECGTDHAFTESDLKKGARNRQGSDSSAVVPRLRIRPDRPGSRDGDCRLGARGEGDVGVTVLS